MFEFQRLISCLWCDTPELKRMFTYRCGKLSTKLGKYFCYNYCCVLIHRSTKTYQKCKINPNIIKNTITLYYF